MTWGYWKLFCVSHSPFGDLSELVYVVKIPLDSVDIWYIWKINTGQHMLIKHCWLVLIWVEFIFNSIGMKRKHVIKENLLMSWLFSVMVMMVEWWSVGHEFKPHKCLFLMLNILSNLMNFLIQNGKNANCWFYKELGWSRVERPTMIHGARGENILFPNIRSSLVFARKL